MPANVEIKARVADPEPMRARIAAIADEPPTVLQQRDTFFPCAHGRLKLREFSPDEGELIAYARPDVAGVKQSDYVIAKTSGPEQLANVLTRALGSGPIVVKTRELYLVGQTRIHLDEVDGLGWFLELEVVLQPGQTTAEGDQITCVIMAKLQIAEGDLVDRAYADLLEAKRD